MNIDEVKLLYAFNDWVDARILAACARVSPEQYAAPTSIGTWHGGLRETMVHMLDSMWQDRDHTPRVLPGTAGRRGGL